MKLDMTETSPNERLEKLLKHSNLTSLLQLAEYLDIPRQQLYDVNRGKCGISRNLADTIVEKFPDVSKEWLRTGYGTMLTSPSVTAKATNNSSANVTIGSHNNYAPAPVKTEVAAPSNTIPLIPIDAIAGPIAEYTSTGILASQCEQILSPIAGATCAIRVSGDSMATEYNNGDICILKRINPSIFVEWGKVYVLDTENGAVLKEVRKCDDDGMVSCVSLNPNPKYRPFEIGMENIYGWYRVLMVMAMK